MGGKLGDWWVGKEIEHSKFYGTETVFFDTAYAFLSINDDKAVRSISHWYFNVWRLNFFQESVSNFLSFWTGVEEVLIGSEKLMTIELKPTQLAEERFEDVLYSIRHRHKDRVNLMLRLKISAPELNDFSIKIQNTVAKASSGVWVVDSGELIINSKLTLWDKYKEDIPGSVYLKEYDANKTKAK